MNLLSRSAAIALTLLVAGSGAARAEGSDRPPAPEAVTVRVVYTTSLFRAVTENDARAAVKVWVNATAQEMRIPVTSEVEVVPDAEGLARGFESGQFDMGSTTIREFLQVESRLNPESVFLPDHGGVANVRYLLLVRRDSDIHELRDLRGAELKWFDTFQASLAIPWLEVSLAEQGLGSAAGFFGRLEPVTKLSPVVLPVFFGTAKACLVTRDGFETLAELNPQVGRDLRVLAESPGLATMITFFRRDFKPPYFEDIVHAILTMHRSPTGRQILMLAQGDALVIAPPTALDSSRELMRRWRGRNTKPTARPAAARERAIAASEAGR